jgi:acetylornithine deacetylase/succinyl-diaminopimelate desuccinylase-like protein
MGFGLPDDNLHAPNEKMEIEQFLKGIQASAYLMQEPGPSSTLAPRAARRSRR